MAGTQVQRRRGTTAEHATFTGVIGETTVDLTKKTVVVHDGATAGGFALAREDALNTEITNRTNAVSTEVTNRASADTALQTQINAITARARGAVSFSNTISGGVTAPVEKYVSTGGTLAGGGTAGIYDSTAGTFTANAAGMWLFKMSIQLNVVSAFITYYIRTSTSSQVVFGECRNAGISGAFVEAMFALSAGETVVATAYFSGSSDQTTSRYITFQYLGN